MMSLSASVNRVLLRAFAAGLLVVLTLAQVACSSEDSAPQSLPPEAQRALDNGKVAGLDKAWSTAIDYFGQARRAAPFAPQPLFYLGLGESQIQGRELRAIAYYHAFLALNSPDAAAKHAAQQSIDELEVKVRATIERLRGLMKQLANNMDFAELQRQEFAALDELAKQERDLPTASPSAGFPFSEPLARWRAQRWVDLVESRMDIPSFLDFDRAKATTLSGQRLGRHYPRDPYQEETFDTPVLYAHTTPAQERFNDAFFSTKKIADDFLAGLADVLNTQSIQDRVQRSLAGVAVKRVLGPWPCAAPFSEGLAAIASDVNLSGFSSELCKASKWGFIDASGRLVIPERSHLGQAHSQEPRFSEGLAGKGTVFLDKAGGIAIEGVHNNKVLWSCTGDFHEGLARVGEDCYYRSDAKWGFVNKTGKLVLPMNWTAVGNFSEGLARVEQHKRAGFIDKSGRLVIPMEWDTANCCIYVTPLMESFNNGLAAVRRNDHWGFIDKTGNIIVPLRWGMAYPFREGLAAVESGDKWGFIDTAGKVVIPLTFDDAEPFADGLAAVKAGKTPAYIDKTGKMVIVLPSASELESFRDGLARVKFDSRWRLINKRGEAVAPQTFPSVLDYSEHMIMVEMDATYAGHIHGEKGFVEVDW
jgi:hypothetical protein